MDAINLNEALFIIIFIIIIIIIIIIKLSIAPIDLKSFHRHLTISMLRHKKKLSIIVKLIKT